MWRGRFIGQAATLGGLRARQQDVPMQAQSILSLPQRPFTPGPLCSFLAAQREAGRPPRRGPEMALSARMVGDSGLCEEKKHCVGCGFF